MCIRDRAGTMTAITTGVKSHMGAIGVAAGVKNNCADSLGTVSYKHLDVYKRQVLDSRIGSLPITLAYSGSRAWIGLTSSTSA